MLRSECLRLLGDISQAAELWQDLPVADVPDSVLAAWWREQIRIALALRQSDRYVSRLEEIEPLMARDAELGLA